VAGVRALRRCEVCLFDALLDPALLAELPPAAQRVDVGKRCGEHRQPQAEISRLLTVYARRGLRVVRLKGGDAGLFGRLAEEVEAVENLQLPYRVLPGISSLNAATTGTGMLLTRRGVSRGFCALTPRAQGGDTAPVDRTARAALPIVFFMGADVVAGTADALLRDGTPAATPAAMVFDAGGEGEAIVRAELAAFATQRAEVMSALVPHASKPGLFLVGEVTRAGYDRSLGALQGRRVLLTCSEALQDKTADQVCDAGGVPLRRPLIRLAPCAERPRPWPRWPATIGS